MVFVLRRHGWTVQAALADARTKECDTQFQNKNCAPQHVFEISLSSMSHQTDSICMICSVFGRLTRLEGQWQREATENVLDFIMVRVLKMDFVICHTTSLLPAWNEVVLKRFLAERRKLGHEFQNEFQAGKLNLAINRDTRKHVAKLET